MRVGLKIRIGNSPRVLSLNLHDLPPRSEEPEWTGSPIEVPEFCLLPPVRPRPLSILSSVVVHGTTLCGLLIIAPLLTPEPLTEYAVRMVPKEQIELRLPLFLHKPVEPPPPAKTESAPKRPRKPEPPAAKAAVERPKIQLPPLRPQPKTELTLLQPLAELKPDQVVNVRLPQVMQWSVVPKVSRPLKRFVMPGNTVRNTQVPQLEAAPKLDMPNKMPDVRDLKMTGEVVLDRPPALAVPRATTMPVRTFVPPRAVPATAPAGLDILQGDDVNIVAISPQPANAIESLRLPPGSQMASIHDVKRPEATQLGTSLAAEPSQGANTTPAEAGTGNKTSQTATGQGQSASASLNNGGGNTNTRGAGTRDSGSSKQLPGGLTISGGRSTGPGTGSNSTTPPAISGPLVPIRIEHPENRTFDVVVVQSSATIDASGAGLLSGSPIYTVYVPVRPTRSWVMQYCIPKESAIQRRQGIAIQLSNPAPVKAPYPRLTVIPPILGNDRITLHGFLTETGSFRDLRVVVGEKLAGELMVLSLLNQWTFRPATRDGRPVEVEIVMVIPRERG